MSAPQQYQASHPIEHFDMLICFVLEIIKHHQHVEQLTELGQQASSLYQTIVQDSHNNNADQMAPSIAQKYIFLYELLAEKLNHIPEHWRLASEASVFPNPLHKSIRDFLVREKDIYDQYKNQKYPAMKK